VPLKPCLILNLQSTSSLTWSVGQETWVRRGHLAPPAWIDT